MPLVIKPFIRSDQKTQLSLDFLLPDHDSVRLISEGISESLIRHLVRYNGSDLLLDIRCPIHLTREQILSEVESILDSKAHEVSRITQIRTLLKQQKGVANQCERTY